MSARSYRIQVAAQVSGVKEQLIRAWERRYGVLHPERTPGGYRTYSDADIEVLKRLKQLTAEGVSIAEAVKLLPSIRREMKQDPPGAHAIHKPPTAMQLAAWRDEILVTAARLDQASIDAVLLQASSSLPPTVFFDQLIAPLLREVGDRWHAGTITIAEEHLISHAARQRLMALLAQAPRRSKHHVVCACPPEEEHDLGLLGAALHFRHAGWRITFLGARTPTAHLARVVHAVEPQLVAISIVNGEGAAKFLEALKAALPDGPRVVIGGAWGTTHLALLRKHGFETLEEPGRWTKVLKERT